MNKIGLGVEEFVKESNEGDWPGGDGVEEVSACSELPIFSLCKDKEFCENPLHPSGDGNGYGNTVSPIMRNLF